MDPGPTEPLSPTELEVLRLLATGATNREIARARGISEATVKKHLTNINAKLGTGNRTEAMLRALEYGLVEVATPPGEPADPEAARNLAAELERMRRRSRRLVRWSLVAAAGALSVALLAIVWRPDTPSIPPAAPTPNRPSGPAWQVAGSLPSPRTGLAVALAEGGLFAVGGADADGPLSETLRYDRTLLTWRRLADKPTAVRDAEAEAIRGQIVVPGGCSDDQATAVVEAYDPALDAWSDLRPLPEPRCAYGLAAHDGRLFLFGGRTGTDASTASADVWSYDPAADTWTADEPMPFPRSDLAAVRMGDRDEIHILGGRNRDGEPGTDHWVFRPNADTNRWDIELGAPFTEARAGLTAAAALDRMYVVGGGWEERRDSVFWERLQAPGDWHHDPAHFPDPGPPVPQRGAAMLRVEARKLAIVGGEAADGRLLYSHFTIDLAPFSINIPGGG